MQVSCDKSHVSRFDYLSQWYQDEFNENWSNCWLKKLMKCSWYMSISQICEFLSIIYKILLENCMISCELDKKNHKVSMKYHVWMCIQWFEETIHDNADTYIFWFWSEMCSQSWLVQSCSERCALTIWQKWCVMLSCFLFMKTECCWIKLQNLWQRTVYNNTMFWTMMIKIQKIHVFHKNFNKS